MGKPILWSADRIQTNENNRFVSDTNITNWNNKLENIIVTDWNNAITSGFYNGDKGATNAPDTSVALSGYIITSGNLIIQQLYPEDNSTEELIYYIRKGFNNNGNITWSKWFITNLYMEEYYTRILKHVDYNYELTLAVFGNVIDLPDTVTSIIFTDIKMPSNATLIDADDDGDGGVVAWVDPSDNTKMYVSTQKSGIKIEAHESSTRIFTYCENLTSIDLSNFDTSNATDMKEMFCTCESLATVNVSSFDTSKVTDMSGMFSGCTSLTKLDVSNFNTSNVNTMYSMFSYCENLTSIDLSNFNTSNVTNMSRMFCGSSGLTSLDLSNFDTSKVTVMYDMFNSCSSLTSLNLSNFDVSKVTNMADMFRGCSGLISLNLSNWNMGEVDMNSMFINCTKLTSLNLSSWNTSNVTKIYEMFSGCNSLVSLDLSSWNTSKVISMRHMFDNCNKLTTIKVGNKFKWISTLSQLGLTGTWKDETGTQYTSSSTFPSNVEHTYTKVA